MTTLVKKMALLSAPAFLAAALCTTASAATVTTNAQNASAVSQVSIDGTLLDGTAFHLQDSSAYSGTQNSFGQIPTASVTAPHLPLGYGVTVTQTDYHNSLATTGIASAFGRVQFTGGGGCSPNCSMVKGQSSSSGSLSFTLDQSYAFTLKTDYQFLFPVIGASDYEIDLLSSLSGGGPTFSTHYHAEDGSAATGPVSQVWTGVLPLGTYLWEFSGQLNLLTSELGNLSGDASYTSTLELTAVPLPAAAWLLLSGLGCVGAFARRRALAAA